MVELVRWQVPCYPAPGSPGDVPGWLCCCVVGCVYLPCGRPPTPQHPQPASWEATAGLVGAEYLLGVLGREHPQILPETVPRILEAAPV